MAPALNDKLHKILVLIKEHERKKWQEYDTLNGRILDMKAGRRDDTHREWYEKHTERTKNEWLTLVCLRNDVDDIMEA